VDDHQAAADLSAYLALNHGPHRAEFEAHALELMPSHRI
jgi:hypothetical protein